MNDAPVKVSRSNPTRQLLTAAFAGAVLLLIFLLGASTISLSAQAQRPSDSQTQKKQEADDEPLKLHSDLVVVNVTVTDEAGQYAHGLKAADFAVLEDGATQTLDSFSAEETPFAAAVLIDMSGSMEHKFGLARAAAASFVDHIRDNDQVAVYGFNNEVRQFQDFTNVRDITDYIWDATARDNTRLYDCMNDSIEALSKREEKRRAIVLISDGCDTVSSKSTMPNVMRRALGLGITIYTVDLIEDIAVNGGTSAATGLRRGRSEMKQFAAETGGRYIHTPQGDKLEDAFTKIVEELRNQYTVSYYSSNRKRDGRWRKIRVGVTRGGLATRARTGYWAPKG